MKKVRKYPNNIDFVDHSSLSMNHNKLERVLSLTACNYLFVLFILHPLVHPLAAEGAVGQWLPAKFLFFLIYKQL